LSSSRTDAQGLPGIRFLIPYFGEWPYWFPFFLESCRRNPTIDWLFFTDCRLPSEYPSNVQFVTISFAEYCEQVSRRLDIRFTPESPYKLCDIKPALGAIHSEYLDGYDFWAFGDIDVIYGDLRAYFTAERLAHKDLFATHTRRVSGHLCLLRNTEAMREAFKRIPRWQERYADARHQALDEGAFSRIFIRHKNWPEWLRLFAARFYPWSRRAEFIEAHSTYTLLRDGTRVAPERWFFDDGVLTNSEQTGETFPYLHFMVWKNEAWRLKSVEQLQGPVGLHRQPNWQIDADGWKAGRLHG
jgi:hypothetical protein